MAAGVGGAEGPGAVVGGGGGPRARPGGAAHRARRDADAPGVRRRQVRLSPAAAAEARAALPSGRQRTGSRRLVGPVLAGHARAGGRAHVAMAARMVRRAGRRDLARTGGEGGGDRGGAKEHGFDVVT